MHALRWTETKAVLGELCDNAVENNRWDEIQRIQGVLAAFENDWEDATDLYVDYFGAKNT